MRQIVEDKQTEYERPPQLEVLPGGSGAGDKRARKRRQNELAVAAKTDRKAAGKLLAELYPLVEWQAKKQQGLGVDLDDLVQEGMRGVLKAIEAYTEQRGASFATYAHWWAHGAMRTAIAWHQRTIRVPEYRGLIAGKERKARERAAQKLGRTPTDLDVAQEMGVDVEEIWRVQAETAPLTSVEALMEASETDDEETAGPRPSESQISYLRSDYRDLTGEPERIAVRRVLREGLQEEVREAMSTLRGRDRRVLRLRHWGGLTRREITEKTGLTTDAIRWSEKRAWETLRKDKNLRDCWRNFW
jgi:RNA polymerase sigma factor (sigma-70 family)